MAKTMLVKQGKIVSTQASIIFLLTVIIQVGSVYAEISPYVPIYQDPFAEPTDDEKTRPHLEVKILNTRSVHLFWTQGVIDDEKIP